MSGDPVYRKSSSPQSSTEVSSLQVNRLKNKEALEKRLKCRPPIKELVNQGILLNPSISHPDKVRQLQRARTSDILKHKIERRPDRQSLINRRIIREDKPGASPFISEQCHNLEKYRLKNSLSSKLTARPGSLELIEKGVLQVDPGVDSLIRCGSLQYPRVETPCCMGNTTSGTTQPIPTPPPLPLTKSAHRTSTAVASNTPNTITATTSTVASGTGSQRPPVSGKQCSSGSNSRSMKDETVISKYGVLVFHDYCPKSFNSETLDASSTFLEKQRAREAQQADLLRLQDTALAHQLVQKELCDLAMRRQNYQKDGSSEARSTSPASRHTSHRLTPEPSIPLSHSSSPSQPLTIGSQQSPSSVNPLTPGESGSGHSGSVQSISWMGDTNSVVFTLDTPPENVGSGSASTTGTLAQLNKSQLRAECRERKFPRSGKKAALIRQLEPHTEEILSKYFPSSSSFKSDAPDLSPSSKAIPFQLKSLHSVPTNGSGSHSYSQPLPPPPPPPPVWTAPVPSPGSMLTLNSSQFLTTAGHAAGLLLCPATQTMQTVLGAPASLNAASSTTLLFTSQNGLSVGSTSAMRHSSSAPFMHEEPGAVSGHILESEAVTQPTNTHMNSVPSTPLIPIKLETANLTNNAVPASHPIGMYLGMVQTPMLSGTSGNGNKPTIFFTPNVLSFAHTTNLLSETPATPVDTNATPTNPAVDNVASSAAGTELFPTQTSTFGPVTSTVTNSDAFNSVQRVEQFACLPDEHLPSGELPSLGHIEDMWLRIRELRRLITKESKCIVSEQIPARIRQLESEHNRLTTLFRLVIIERIDALTELPNSGDYDCNLENANPNSLQSVDRQVELNLMYSYLRKLGVGATLAGRSGLFPCSRLRRSSSPLLEVTADTHRSKLVPKSGHVTDSTQEPMTSTPRMESQLVQYTNPMSESNPTTSWPNDIQSALSNRHRSSPVNHPSGLTVHIDDFLSSNEPSEPPASPMNTDCLFELWDSVAKDSARSLLSRPQLETGNPHCSSLPRNLSHGSYGSCMKPFNQHFSCMTDDVTAEHFDSMCNHMHSDEPVIDHVAGSSRCLKFLKSNDLDSQPKESNNRSHRTPSNFTSNSCANLVPSTAAESHSERYKSDTLLTPVSSSGMSVDVDLCSLITTSGLFPISTPEKNVSSGSAFFSATDSGISHTPFAASATNAPEPPSLTFDSLESYFPELMDTGDPSQGFSPLIMNWTGDA